MATIAEKAALLTLLDEIETLRCWLDCGRIFDADRGPCLDCAAYERYLGQYEAAFRTC